MTFSVNVLAGLKTEAYKPAGTSKTAILTGESGASYTLVGIRALSTSGTPTLTLHFYDDSKSAESIIYPATATSTSTVTTIDLSGITLGVGDELRATVSATAMDILLTYAVRGGGSGT